jgi:hypothetical protein
MRTISVRFSAAEHRLLTELAAARDVSVETLVREELTLPPFDPATAPYRRLRVVRADDLLPGGDRPPDHVVPAG